MLTCILYVNIKYDRVLTRPPFVLIILLRSSVHPTTAAATLVHIVGPEAGRVQPIAHKPKTAGHIHVVRPQRIVQIVIDVLLEARERRLLHALVHQTVPQLIAGSHRFSRDRRVRHYRAESRRRRRRRRRLVYSFTRRARDWKCRQADSQDESGGGGGGHHQRRRRHVTAVSHDTNCVGRVLARRRHRWPTDHYAVDAAVVVSGLRPLLLLATLVAGQHFAHSAARSRSRAHAHTYDHTRDSGGARQLRFYFELFSISIHAGI